MDRYKIGSPERIVCLTEEPTEILCLLGLEKKIVGISAFTVRPPHIRESKPVVSAFVDGSVQKIKALDPDLIIGFSDIQAKLAHDLIKENLPVLIFNQRSIQEILDVILSISRIVGAETKGKALVRSYVDRLSGFERAISGKRPVPLYFEEWDDPQITAIEWVSELISLAGGVDIFRDKSFSKGASGRFVSHEKVLAAKPEIMICSWCGKKLDRGSVMSRPGIEKVVGVNGERLFEMDPAIILQPGPACITSGLDSLMQIISSVETA